jgi:hypothetical protein
MLSSVRSLKRKWFCLVEKFGVFQQYRPKAVSCQLILDVRLVPDAKVNRGILNVSYRQISRSKIIDQGLKARRIEFTYDLNRLLRDVIGCSPLRIF